MKLSEEKIAVLEFKVKDKGNAITRLTNQLDKTLREKEDLKAKLKQFKISSKNLNKLINSQLGTKDKTGLGYGDQLNESNSEVLTSVFDNCSSDGDDIQSNDRFKKGDGYHALSLPLTGNYMPPLVDLSFAGFDDSVYRPTTKGNGYHALPLPLTGNYMPPLVDLSFAGLDDSVYRPTTNKTSVSISKSEASVIKTSNISVEKSKVDSVGTSRVIIEDWGNPQQALKYKGMFDSGCSRHTTRNKALLTDYQDIDGGLLPLLEVLKVGLVTRPHNKTPYELIIGKPPSISFIRPFRCPVTILNTLDPLAKFDGKAEEGFLVGYKSSDDKAKDNTANDVAGKKKDVNAASTSRTFSPPHDPLIPELEDTAKIQRSSIFGNAYDEDDLETNNHSYADESAGVEADFNNMEPFTIKVWTLVYLPYGKKAIGTKWVYRIKKDERGIVVRNKAIQVAQGHKQEEVLGIIVIRSSYCDDASIHNETTNTQQQPNIQPRIIATISKNNAKFPYLKKDEYEVWAMKMEYWITNNDMNIWKVFQNGNSLKRTGRDSDGGVIILPPTTVEEHIAVQRESKARTTLLQSIPDDHVANFHYIDDARDIWNAVKARFGGNTESKKIRKSMLKQEFSEFRIGEAEGLHKVYDKMQKILSQLNQLKAMPDAEDISLSQSDGESDGVIAFKNFGMIAGCDTKDAIKEGAAKIYNLITGADTEEVSTTGDAGEFALIGVTSEWRNSSKNLFRLIDSSMSVRAKVGLGFKNCISENELGWDDSEFSVFTTNSEDVEGRPTFHRFAKTDSMKSVPLPLSGDYTSLSDHTDLDESQIDKSSEVNTNDFASSDSSVKSSEPKPKDSTSCASTSSVSTSVNDAEIESNVGTPTQEPIIVQELPSFSCNSFDQHKNTSRTSCNKNGYVNKKAGHSRKNASFVSKLCFVCGSGTHLIKDCDFYEKQMANKTVGFGVG
nr:xylulose kinase-1 [Tanacetum cinerariifolium]